MLHLNQQDVTICTFHAVISSDPKYHMRFLLYSPWPDLVSYRLSRTFGPVFLLFLLSVLGAIWAMNLFFHINEANDAAQ